MLLGYNTVGHFEGFGMVPHKNARGVRVNEDNLFWSSLHSEKQVMLTYELFRTSCYG